MKVLAINKILLKTMGLLGSNPKSNYCIRLTIFWLFLTLILVPLSFTYVCENITDTTKTTEIIYVIATNISSAIKTGYFLVYRDSINDILKRLQETVDKRKITRSNQNIVFQILDFFSGQNFGDQLRTKVYQDNEKMITFLSKLLIVALSILALTALNIPLLFVLFQYLNGNYSPGLWYLPYKLR